MPEFISLMSSIDYINDIYQEVWRQNKSIPALIENLHLCPELPENNNMCITNLRTNLAKVFTGDRWQTRGLDDLLNEIVDRSNLHLDKWMRANRKNEECKKYEDDFINYLEKVGKNKFNEDTKEQLKLALYDAYKNGVVDIKSKMKQSLLNN